MKAINTIEQIGDRFFIVMLFQLSHVESIRFTQDMATYHVQRKYVRVDGNVCLVIEPTSGYNEDFALSEMYCQMNLRQVSIYKCPICENKVEIGPTCGHLIFERFI